MCLNTNQKTALKATKDIKVYKTLQVSNAGKPSRREIINGKVYYITEQVLKSPRGHKYEAGKTYRVAKMDYRSGVVERAFHAYDLNPKTVKRHYASSSDVVVECVVPKGALYYKGTNNGASKGIASNQIRFVK